MKLNIFLYIKYCQRIKKNEHKDENKSKYSYISYVSLKSP